MPNEDISVVAHRRQFILSSAPLASRSDWRSIGLPGGFHFSYQSDLPVSIGDQANKTLLFGHALCSVKRGAGLADAMAGRYGCLDWPYLYPDACALFPIYYGKTPEGVLVSSSLTLAAQAAGESTRQRKINPRGLNWTPPQTRVAGFRKLLRDQRLHVPTGQTEYIDRVLRPAASVAHARDSLAADLTDLSRQLRDSMGTVYLALTAGLDSRTLLAALIAADIRFECITLCNKGMKGNGTDIAVARRIAKHLGIKHHVISPQEPDEAIYRIWCEHTAQTYINGNVYLLPHKQYRFLLPGDILVRGGCFEIGRRFYARRLSGLDFENATGSALWSRFEAGEPEATIVDALAEWLDWRREHDNGLDLIDAFYLDQRLGGWASAAEHSLDMLPGVSMPVANCETVLSALITPDPDHRASGQLQRDTIQQLAPGLSRFPVNPPTVRQRTTQLKRRATATGKRYLKRLLGMTSSG